MNDKTVRRILDTASSVAALLIWWAILASYLDIPGPQDVWERFRSWRIEQARMREAISRTFADIDNLPEVEDA